jgi:hypothetical protein
VSAGWWLASPGTTVNPVTLANPGTANSGIRTPGGSGGRGGGGMGGLLGASTPSAALVTALRADAANYTWAAAVVGSNNAAGYQLAAELPVMAVGGFNGTDPAPRWRSSSGSWRTARSTTS